MSAIFLVRHGQASFGSDEYDRLSPLGLSQASTLGHALAAADVRPALVVAGSLRRQADTAAAMIEGAGWEREGRIDPAWNEFDHIALATATGHPDDPGAFQDALEVGMRAWANGDTHGPETFDGFQTRTRLALQRVLAASPSGSAVVVSSAGVISWLTASLLGGSVDLWIRINRVCVNTGVTKLVHGSRGLSMVSFNEHGHLTRSAVTYR